MFVPSCPSLTGLGVDVHVVLVVVDASLHEPVSHLGRHHAVDHLLLELLLHDELPLDQQRLPHLHEGVPHPHVGHQQDVAAQDVQTDVNQKSDKNSENISEKTLG